MIALTACFSCKQNRRAVSSEAWGIAKDSGYSGSCVNLFKAKDGSVVISWVRDISDSQSVLCYAVSPDGKAFGSTIEVSGSDNVHPHAENLPRVVKTPQGKILAAWGASNPNPKNPYSGLVYFSWSEDNGKSWSTRQTLSRDSNSIDQRYFDIDLLKDGRVGVIWLDSRNDSKKEGSSLYFATFDEKNALVNEKRIDVTCCQCCRTDLFVDKDGNLHTVYRKIINDSIRDMVHAVSHDNGNTFSTPERISADNWVINGCPHSGPAIAQTATGLAFAWYTLGNGGGVFYTSSKDNGKTFSPRDSVSTRPSAKHPQLQVNDAGDQLIVWDESSSHGNRIGLQVRARGGEKVENTFLTDSIGRASFPVIKSLGNQFLVAFSGRKNADDKEQVFYKVIDLQ
jgi:hypothetical protein